MDIGERVRLRAPARGHENIRGEIIECGDTRGEPRLVRWDGIAKPTWYLEDDLLPLLP